MEESQKRKERLKAMRMEAAQGECNTNSGSSGFPSDCLSNPLIESESTAPIQYTSPRFDFYTDPMAAFSGNRKRSNVRPQVSQGHYNTPPRPMHQGTVTPTPINRPINYPGAHFNQSPLGSPMEPPGSLSGFHGNPTSSNWGESFNYNTPPSFPTPSNHHINSPGAHFNRGPIRSPMDSPRPLSNFPPNSRGEPSRAFHYSSRPNFPTGGRFSGPSPCYGRGRGQRYNSDSQYNSGRSVGNNYRSSYSVGQSGGRGRGGPHVSVSAEKRPDLYYSKDMVEDPWRFLNPVVWKGVRTLDSDKSLLPKSISVKKAKVSSDSANASISQQSLAEFLAASFNESGNDAVDDEPGT